MRQVFLPWSDDQVASLNEYQRCGFFHEFTGMGGTPLIATQAGWVEREGGPTVQNWAYEGMTDWSWWFAIGEGPCPR